MQLKNVIKFGIFKKRSSIGEDALPLVIPVRPVIPFIFEFNGFKTIIRVTLEPQNSICIRHLITSLEQ